MTTHDRTTRDCTPRRRPGRRAGAGYTLVEAVVVLAMMAILAALVFVAIGSVVRTVRSTVEGQLIRSIRVAVDQFRQQNGFYPPLLDNRPLEPDGTQARAIPAASDGVEGTLYLISEQYRAAATDAPELLHERYTRYEFGPNTSDPRWSTRTLPAYLFGGLGARLNGSDTSGSGAPSPDGTFDLSGRKIPAVLDIAPFIRRLSGQKFDTSSGRIWAIDCGVLNDRWGFPIRYYRWLPTLHRRDGGPPASFDTRPWPVFPVNTATPNTLIANDLARVGEVRSYNISPAVGDGDEEPRLRTAEYAIVSPGPDGLYGDEPLDDGPGVAGLRSRLGMAADAPESAVRRRARQDNIREVGP